MGLYPKTLVFLSFCYALCGQELPPIQKYGSEEYMAGSQNWMITQNNEGSVFFANNEGLLKFNGNRWNLFPSNNSSKLRSVKSIGNRVYYGSYMDFGFWERDKKGNHRYTSLATKFNITIIENEEFWNILDFNNRIVFQSLNRLIIYDPQTGGIQYIQPENAIFKSFKVDDQIYFQESQRGLFIIKRGKPVLISNNAVLRNEILVGLFKNKNGLLCLTNQSGFIEIHKNKIYKWPQIKNPFDKELTFYSAIQLKDKSFALGTISNGLYLLNEKGELTNHFNFNKGISNNTILSVYEDRKQNIWLGLDNGINCINIKAPFREYFDSNGKLGTVYTTAIHQDHIYLGTNQGLFAKNLLNKDEDFGFVKKTKGQVWNLSIYEDQLLCGHDRGVFKIDRKEAQNISDINGCWIFKQPKNKPDILFKGNYDGIYILKLIDGNWKYSRKLKNYNMSSKFLELVNDTTLLVSHEYKGVFQLTLDSKIEKVTNIKKLESVEKGHNASIGHLDSKIYYLSPKGFYEYRPDQEDFIRDEKISKIIFENGYVSGKMINDNNSGLWLFSKNKIHYLRRDSFSDGLAHNSYAIPQSKRGSVYGNEHISNFRDNIQLLATQSGYMLINLQEYKPSKPEVFLDKIHAFKNDSPPQYLTLDKKIKLDSYQNNLHFFFSSRNFQKYEEVAYQYFLEGYSKSWSDWTEEADVLFKNLSHGDYLLKIRAQIAGEVSREFSSASISISPPWYWSNAMYFIYILAFISLVVIIHKYNSLFYEKKKEKLIKKGKRILEIKAFKNQQEIMKLKNEQLQRDIENKNRELAMSTMQTIKRNKFLSKIIRELKAIESNSNISRIIKIINNNLNRKDDWEFFEKAFNNADKDFFKKIKESHPSLTNNDLQLCAYLRLNLSSKEIAPLLNISVRSVEIKRYRLRKKMELIHDQSLVEYILTL